MTEALSHHLRMGAGDEKIRIPPTDGVQYRQWSGAVRSTEMLRRLEGPVVEMGIERVLTIGL